MIKFHEICCYLTIAGLNFAVGKSYTTSSWWIPQGGNAARV